MKYEGWNIYFDPIIEQETTPHNFIEKQAMRPFGKPIDRDSLEDLYKQIGRTEEVIANFNRKQQKMSDEISGWPKRKEHLEKRINKCHAEISKRAEYIKLLEADLKRITKETDGK